MFQLSAFENSLLSNSGLNLQAVFNIAELPSDMSKGLAQACDDIGRYRQLILIAHGGPALWQSVKAAGLQTDNPIDDFTVATLQRYFRESLPKCCYEIIYPGTRPVGVQALGALAGWHHNAPLGIGINAEWGSWYAYRAVVLADTEFNTSQPIESASPCQGCVKPCVDACPAQALEAAGFNLDKCIKYRLSKVSSCRQTCLARVSCPAGERHRYSDEQLHYHYGVSMKTIERMYR